MEIPHPVYCVMLSFRTFSDFLFSVHPRLFPKELPVSGCKSGNLGEGANQAILERMQTRPFWRGCKPGSLGEVANQAILDRVQTRQSWIGCKPGNHEVGANHAISKRVQTRQSWRGCKPGNILTFNCEKRFSLASI